MESNASSHLLDVIYKDQEEKDMFGSIIHRQGEQAFAHDPALRGYHAVYRAGEINYCPGCGRSHWIIGRFSAECGFCATALALTDTGLMGAGLHSHGHRASPSWPEQNAA